MPDAEEKKLQVDMELRDRYPELDNLGWALILRNPEELEKFIKEGVLDSLPVVAKQMEIDGVYKKSIDLLEEVPDMPFGAMTQKRLNEATKILEETCRDVGFDEGVSKRYQDIVSLVPESFGRVEDTFENEIEAVKKRNYPRVEELFGYFGRFIKRYGDVIRTHGKANEEHWKTRRAGMEKNDAKKFLEAVYAAGNRLGASLNSELSKKRIKVAARIKYMDLTAGELEELEDYCEEIFLPGNERTATASKGYLLDLAEKFDGIPKSIEETTKGPAGIPVELRRIIETLFGRLEKYGGKPHLYKGAFREAYFAMDGIRNSNWFDYGVA